MGVLLRCVLSTRASFLLVMFRFSKAFRFLRKKNLCFQARCFFFLACFAFHLFLVGGSLTDGGDVGDHFGAQSRCAAGIDPVRRHILLGKKEKKHQKQEERKETWAVQANFDFAIPFGKAPF